MATNPADHASELAENGSQSFTAASEQAQDMTQRAARAARETAAPAWDAARQASAAAYDRGKSAARALMRRAEAQPLAALLIAGAVGYATAYLVHGRPSPQATPRRQDRGHETAARETQEFRKRGGRAVGGTDSVVEGHLSAAAGSTQEARGGSAGDVRPRLHEHAKELAEGAGAGIASS